ncbi:hypothetical protein T12_9932 [Trichinella patagoniensis]|uniref:Uncharacterized protein n=1 Tax=Trichinella patagoniensis TaxID=990121 RepID=A0A0V0YYW1_9BILA|nr:hypothetical protein T12_9932 [Trichinella patagoniensis]
MSCLSRVEKAAAVIPKVGDIAPLGAVEGWKGAVGSTGVLGGRWKIMEHIGGGA